MTISRERLGQKPDKIWEHKKTLESWLGKTVFIDLGVPLIISGTTQLLKGKLEESGGGAWLLFS